MPEMACKAGDDSICDLFVRVRLKGIEVVEVVTVGLYATWSLVPELYIDQGDKK